MELVTSARFRLSSRHSGNLDSELRRFVRSHRRSLQSFLFSIKIKVEIVQVKLSTDIWADLYWLVLLLLEHVFWAPFHFANIFRLRGLKTLPTGHRLTSDVPHALGRYESTRLWTRFHKIPSWSQCSISLNFALFWYNDALLFSNWPLSLYWLFPAIVDQKRPSTDVVSPGTKDAPVPVEFRLIRPTTEH